MNPSSSTTRNDESRDYRGSRDRDNDATSSSSDSESENERSLRKKARKEEKKRSKKESKSKEKKEKKSKKEKKEKKERKKDKQTSGNSNSYNDKQVLSEHDAIEMASFREAVQGKQVLVVNERAQASLLHASSEDIASSLGLSKGLIRTAIDDSSITQRYSKDLFGGDDDNPAKRQRLKREHVAKRAVEIARQTLQAKATAAAAATAGNASGTGSKGSGLSDIMNRFSSSNSRIR